MTERDDAIKLAGHMLDRRFADPDDDLAMLSRTLLRSIERTEAAEKVCEAAASVVSEPEISARLTCYVMGVELLTRLEAWRTVKGVQ